MRFSKWFIFVLLLLVLTSIGGWYAWSDSTPADSSDVLSALNEIPPEDRKVEYWQKVIEEVGGDRAAEIFAETYKDFGYNQQHTFAHEFGEALYKSVGIPGVVSCNAEYGFGCYHAFFGWALLENGLTIITDLEQACIEKYGLKGLGCQHGIGHGVIAEVGGDNLVEALEACATLTWQGPIGGCTSGVFMEYNLPTMGEGEEFGPREVGDEGEHYPCTDVPDKFTQDCYFEMPQWWAVRSGHDFVLVGEKCQSVSNTLDREACFRGVGNIIAGSTEYSIEGMISNCGLMPTEEGKFLCVEGATWITGNQPQFESVWKEMCEPYTGEKKERCLESVDMI